MSETSAPEQDWRREIAWETLRILGARGAPSAEHWRRYPEVRKLCDPSLHRVASEVECAFQSEVHDLIGCLKRVVRETGALGLAAPQVGVGLRIIVTNLDGKFNVLINPQIVRGQGEATMREGCLSIPGLSGDVRRWESIIVRGVDPVGDRFKRKAAGLEARVIQHEIDHLNGVVFCNRADPATLAWSNPRVWTSDEGAERHA